MFKKVLAASFFLTIIKGWSLLSQSVTYRSALMKELTENLNSVQEDLGEIDIITEYDSMGRISNIGLDIFDIGMSDFFPDDVCAFISRYFLELLLWDKTSIQQKMMDDKVVFLAGAPEDAIKLRNDMSFSLDRIEDRRYVATWKDGENIILSFSFPIQYELILGMPQAEIELKFADDIECSDTSHSVDKDIPETEMISPGLFRSIPASHFYAKELTDCKYYREKKDGDLEPVFDDRHLTESAANLFQNIIDRDFTLSVRQSLYGFKSTDFTIALSQWLSYCRTNHLKSYFAVEKEDKDSILALIICESRDLAFNHMLSVAIPKSFIKNNGTMFKAKLNAFIPTHNVAELYQDKDTRANEL